MKILFDNPTVFSLTLTRMDNPNSQVDTQNELRDLVQMDPREMADEFDRELYTRPSQSSVNWDYPLPAGTN